MAILNLFFMTYQDYKNNMKVDDRFNFIMIGATVMLLSVFPISIYYLFTLVALNLILGWVFMKFRLMKFADVKSLSWAFYGFSIINPFFGISYLVVFGLIYFFNDKLISLVRWYLNIECNKLPGYPILLLIFVINLMMSYLIIQPILTFIAA